MGTKKETGRSRSPERDPWKGLLVHSLVIQSLHVLDGGDSGVDGDVAALHCVDGHLGDLVLLDAHVSQASGDAQVSVQLMQSVAQHAGNEVLASILAGEMLA